MFAVISVVKSIIIGPPTSILGSAAKEKLRSSPRTLEIKRNSKIKIADDNKWELKAPDIKIGKQIGQGSFGVVFKAKLHGMDVAVKKIAASASSSEKALAANMLNREVKALRRCRHKNIVQLIGACSNPPMLVLAFASNGTLRDLLSNNQLVPSRLMELIHGICDGMTMLHSQNILHLDLKPENILLDGDTVKLADLGSCRGLYQD